jgi:cytidine deaminase
VTKAAVDWPALERAAISVRQSAHAPYSHYRVGAALVTRRGKTFVGCNVENASYGLCLCAERSAIAQMVAAGERDPIAIVVVTEGPRPGSPCGMCRQTLAEFAEDLAVRLVADGLPAATRSTTLAALLPDAFRSDSLTTLAEPPLSRPPPAPSKPAATGKRSAKARPAKAPSSKKPSARKRRPTLA